MKTYKVYELINSIGTVEYVGVTMNPEIRWRQHVISTPKAGNGMFHGRFDLSINIVKELNSRKEAMLEEGILKQSYGMEWTELTGAIRGRSIGGKIGGQIQGRKNVESGQISINGKITQSIERICPHCNKTIKGMVYFRYHGDKCKQK
jgi:predicted GIY-YIG superfamily endonuclease